MKGRKTTTIDLVEELQASNTNGRFNQLIYNAQAGRYHDAFHLDGKLQFLRDTDQFPDLVEIRLEIRAGVYDELPAENFQLEQENTPGFFRHIFASIG